jgi:hypothetical protein
MKKNSKTNGLFILICLGFMAVWTGCNAVPKDEFQSTDMYDLANPVVVNLPQELDEISGIAYYPKDTSVFAIIDEDGLLYKIPILHPNNVKEWRFDKKRDFEDLVLRDSSFYILVSNGDIERVDFKNDSIVTSKTNFSDESKKVNEFETLYLADSNKLIIMCKQCEEDKKAKVSSFLLNDSNSTYTFYNEIESAPIAKNLGEEKIAIKPSAAAINPITKELYILSSVSKMLVILSPEGKFKSVYKLNPKIYKQPEGMAFTPQGDLIISNEVYLEGYATLLIMKNKKKGK